MKLKEVLEVYGFEFDEEMGFYICDDWILSMDKEEIENTIRDFDDGERICIMNREDYKKGMKYMIENVSDCGVWIFGNLEDCVELMEEYY